MICRIPKPALVLPSYVGRSEIVLQSVLPTWDPAIHHHKITFHKNRVTAVSANNFILEDVETKERVFQMGKVNHDLYIMDYKYPLNAVQAFAIAIASFATNSKKSHQWTVEIF